ncbi:hypothetical protein L0P54_04225 [Anaerosalibacter bizertensis]|uniref:Uncharacterized protein n=1 Tax=Anaerosalibacter bizertensis TaxID=932217 RepID=A0A9Q4AC49_9FIRM|nr:hypothetical protein [Anaerosalibacter bizertensis]MBV1817049.1 hypothetical protein [Bacteroidales bacterium MSK.15.36]MCB5560293.1 hypothetical protein [Anaerosalibacter bizertensis]MCG4564813.1 hypothetical protein [Anaerosalibacter bizertensis]MCG4582183.1 hypothetical protein [Anaerosalibacter bizertensis]MCG4585380.1 hypothetical protein [Anaerosalibacter bizertensis]
MKKFAKVLSCLLSFIMVIGLSIPIFATDYNVIENDEQIVQEGIIPTDLELTRDENGDFVGQGYIVDRSTTKVIYVNYKLRRDVSFDNVYEIFYNIKSGAIVDHIITNITVQSTSALKPKIYDRKSVNRKFSASTYYSGSAGKVIIPSNVKKVKMKANNTRVHSLHYGWISCVNFSGTYTLR